MKKNTITVLLLAATMLLFCCACGKTEPEKPAETPAPAVPTAPAPTETPKDTPAQIAEKMDAALEKTPCGHVELVMDMKMAVDDGEGGTLDVSTKSVSDIVICQSPLSCRTVVTADTEAQGETETTVSESYAVMEGDKLVTYVCSDGIWIKMENAQTAEDLKNSAANVSVDISNAAIDESITEWEGRKVICLTTTVSGDALDSVIGSLLEGFENEAETVADAAELLNTADYAALSCDCRIYLDAETYLPLLEEMVYEGMTEVMAPIYADMGLTVEVTECTGTGTYFSYDAQEEIILPEGAAEKAEAWGRLLAGDPDNGDGTYTIREGAVLTDIAAPEGFELDEADYDHVYFTRDDFRQLGYSMWYLEGDAAAGDAYFYEMIDALIPDYKSMGYQTDSAKGTYSAENYEFSCELLDLTWGNHNDAEAYAWVPLGSDSIGTYFLFVEIYDGYDNGPGVSKNADLTEEDFLAYLNAVSENKLLE